MGLAFNLPLNHLSHLQLPFPCPCSLKWHSTFGQTPWHHRSLGPNPFVSCDRSGPTEVFIKKWQSENQLGCRSMWMNVKQKWNLPKCKCHSNEWGRIAARVPWLCREIVAFPNQQSSDIYSPKFRKWHSHLACTNAANQWIGDAAEAGFQTIPMWCRGHGSGPNWNNL